MKQTYEAAEPVKNLKLHPRNPRRGQTDLIQRSIESHGFYGAVVAQRTTGYVLAGNHRLLAAQATGRTELPVLWVDADDDEALRILLVDNRASDLATYDEGELAKLLRDLRDEEAALLESVGYGSDDVDELLRLSGTVGREEAGFLDKLADDADAGKFGAGSAEERHDWFNVSVTVTSEERDEIRTAIAEAKDRLHCETAAEAMVEICRHFLARPPAKKKVTA